MMEMLGPTCTMVFFAPAASNPRPASAADQCRSESHPPVGSFIQGALVAAGDVNAVGDGQYTQHQWRFGLRLGAEIVDSDEILPPFAMPGLDLRGIPAAGYQGENVARGLEDTAWYIQVGSAW